MMLVTRIKKGLLLKFAIILAGCALFSMLSLSSLFTSPASAASSPQWTWCGFAEQAYCTFSGTKIVEYGWSSLSGQKSFITKKLTSKTYTLANGSTVNGVFCSESEFGHLDPGSGTSYICMYRDPDPALDTTWSASVGEGNKSVTVSFSVTETQVGTLADLKSKIMIKRTDEAGFKSLDPDDSVSNTTSGGVSKLQINFKNPLMGLDNQIRIDAGALADIVGEPFNGLIEVNDLDENDLGSWQYVGNRGFSVGKSLQMSLEFVDGTPYIAYVDGTGSGDGLGGKLNVKKYDAITKSWVLAGNGVLSAGAVSSISTSVSDGILYAAYSDAANGNKVSVKKYDGSSWLPVGSGDISTDQAYGISLKVSDGSPYVAYEDGTRGYKITVKKYDESTDGWVTMGSEGFSQDTVSQISLSVYDGTPYVAYRNEKPDRILVGGKWQDITVYTGVVKKFDKIKGWVDLGQFADGGNQNTSLIVDGGIPYVAYVDWLTGNSITLKKYEGSGWTRVDNGSLKIVGDGGNFVGYTSFYFSGGTLYAAYSGSDAKATVKKFNGSSWVTVGVTGITESTALGNSLNVDNGVPYLANSVFILGGDPAVDRKPGVQKFLLTPPALTADTTNNDTVSPIDITFPDLAVWRNEIIAVRDGTTVISGADYKVSAGKIMIGPGVLAKGNHTISVSTRRYADATLSQMITPRPPTLTADMTINNAANAIDITFPDDAAWRGAITAVKDGTATLPPETYIISAGKITLGAGVLAEGNHTITVSATDYTDTSVNQTIQANTADLSGLGISGGSLSFAAATTSYTLSVASSVTNVTVTPTAADATASVTVAANGGASSSVTSGQSSESIPLSVGANTITVVVKTQNGAITKTYTIHVIRISNDALLSSLSVDQSTISPAFAPSELEYSVNVPNTVSILNFTVTKANPNQTLMVTGATNSTVAGNVYAYSFSNLIVGSNPIPIMVTAQDGMTMNTYSLTVNRAPIASSNADLSGLSLSGGVLSPAFTSGTSAYTSIVDNGVSSLTVTASVYDSKATMTVNGISISSGQASGAINLSVGPNPIEIVVTAQNGSSKVYQVIVTREAPAIESSGRGDSTAPSNPPVISADGHLTLPIGTAGEVSLQSEVTVSIPANASSQELKVTIDKVLESSNLLSNKEVPVSPIFEILKNFSGNFSKPVALTFAFDPTSLSSGQKASVFYFDEVKKEWVEVGGIVNGNHINVEVNHFTKYAVFAVGQAAEGPKKDSSTDTKLNFSDISGHWSEAGIKQAVKGGIVTGYPGGTFKPNHTVTRAEFAVMLMNALKQQGAGASLTFTDKAKIGAWAQQAVAQAVRDGIIKGYEDGSFRPDEEITRAEMAVTIAKALSKSIEANAATGFADDKDIPAWAKDSVAYVKQAGIVQGKGDNEYAPQDPATRAEAVTILLNMLAHKNK